MKAKLFLALCLLLLATSALAQEAENTALQQPLPDLNLPLPDYLNSKPVDLTAQEKAALQLAQDWAKVGNAPYRDSHGRLIYVHGANVPTVIGMPFQICDIELQPGEELREIIIGDSARWLLDTATSGSSLVDITHVMVKPVDSGLETSAVITTNRRVYHLRLVSQREGHTPYIGFAYQEAFVQQYAQAAEKEERARAWRSFEHDGEQAYDLSQLNFAYWVDGYASWKPSQVYDTGRQTFIRLPESSKNNEAPVLLVRKNDQDILVNYRVKGASIVVDGVFDHLVLILGVGSDQERVNIIREGK
ncbi:MAG: P-type conjugative transfer protein TrbG [Desulfarculales bacterium]|jgi:type IV secretion system protein VirB9|nr:P-type conjugative transfer protein TrbG [Desulfarculales bacterium]